MPAASRYLLVVLVCCLAEPSAGESWPQFRGPDGQGHANVERLPLRWSEEAENIAWKVDVEGLGWSAPAVAKGRVWLTTATDEGRSLRVVALDAKSGAEFCNAEVFHLEEAGKIHSKNSHASPTPYLESDRVYVHFGRYGTACLTDTGEVLWRRELPYQHVHGPGGSPVVVGNMLIVSCDGGDVQYVVALDKKSGEIAWQTERPENPYAKKFAFSTPLAIEVQGQTQVVSSGAGGVSSYDPQTGREIWRCDYPEGYSVVPRPVFGQGLVFLSSGFDRPSLLAIRADGAGNVTQSHIAWQENKGAPRNASPLLIGDELYMVSDNGVATCLDATSGEVHWQERLGGNFSASPLYGADRIYFLNEAGETVVIAPGQEFQELARNTLSGRALASLAAIEGAIFLRTDTSLYRIDAERSANSSPR